MKYSIFVIISLLITSCASIQPETPIIEVTQIPDLVQPSSTVVVPIKINLTPYFKDTDKSIPKKFTGKEENCEGVSFAYTFLREPISFKGDGNDLQFDVDGKYSLNINYCPQCTDLFDKKGNCVVPRLFASCGSNGEPMREISVGYKTSIDLTTDYKLKSSTNLRNVDIKNPCEITVFKYDASKTLKKEITKALENIEKDIDKEIGKVNLKPEAEKSWKIIAQPISLGKFGYFNTNPSKIGFDNLNFKDNYATAELALVLNPTLTTTKPDYKPVSLPKLSEVNQNKGFNITLDIVSTYDSLSTLLTSELKGKEIMLKKKKVIFETIEVFGASNNQLSLKIGFSGSKKGVLYLLGTPNFNQESQNLAFPDLTFDVKTKSALLKSAKWLFSDKITDALRKSSTLDLHPHLISVQQMMEKQLNTTLQPGVKLKGNITQISMKGIYPNKETLTLRVNTTGVLELEM